MYIKNNIKSKGVLNISKFYRIDFSKIKICRPTKIHIGGRRNRRNAACTELLLGTRGKPSTWFPRGELSEQINKKKKTTQHEKQKRELHHTNNGTNTSPNNKKITSQ